MEKAKFNLFLSLYDFVRDMNKMLSHFTPTLYYLWEVHHTFEHFRICMFDYISLFHSFSPITSAVVSPLSLRTLLYLANFARWNANKFIQNRAVVLNEDFARDFISKRSIECLQFMRVGFYKSTTMATLLACFLAN